MKSKSKKSLELAVDFYKLGSKKSARSLLKIASLTSEQRKRLDFLSKKRFLNEKEELEYDQLTRLELEESKKQSTPSPEPINKFQIIYLNNLLTSIFKKINFYTGLLVIGLKFPIGEITEENQATTVQELLKKIINYSLNYKTEFSKPANKEVSVKLYKEEKENPFVKELILLFFKHRRERIDNKNFLNSLEAFDRNLEVQINQIKQKLQSENVSQKKKDILSKLPEEDQQLTTFNKNIAEDFVSETALQISKATGKPIQKQIFLPGPAIIRHIKERYLLGEISFAECQKEVMKEIIRGLSRTNSAKLTKDEILFMTQYIINLENIGHGDVVDVMIENANRTKQDHDYFEFDGISSFFAREMSVDDDALFNKLKKLKSPPIYLELGFNESTSNYSKPNNTPLLKQEVNKRLNLSPESRYQPAQNIRQYFEIVAEIYRDVVPIELNKILKYSNQSPQYTLVKQTFYVGKASASNILRNLEQPISKNPQDQDFEIALRFLKDKSGDYSLFYDIPNNTIEIFYELSQEKKKQKKSSQIDREVDLIEIYQRSHPQLKIDRSSVEDVKVGESVMIHQLYVLNNHLTNDLTNELQLNQPTHSNQNLHTKWLDLRNQRNLYLKKILDEQGYGSANLTIALNLKNKIYKFCKIDK